MPILSKPRPHTLYLCGSLLAAACSASFADEHGHMAQHGSHEHGAARLTIATTDAGLEITLESPAANLFGFEHKASSDEEHHVVHEIVEKLKDGSTLFTVDKGASCSLDGADVESSLVAHHDEVKHDAEHDKQADHSSHNDEKHDDHDEKAHDDHDHDNHDDAGGTSHSDVEATWTFHCEKPDAISAVSTQLFGTFPDGFEHIVVEWINADQAGRMELEKDGRVELK